MSEAYRLATESDLPALVALLADDPLGATRETAGADLHPDYRAAFHAIDRDPHHELILAESGDRIVGMLQLSFLPNLTYHGGWRAQIESVRIARDARGQGAGARLIGHAVERARKRGCRLVQLTTDKARPEALRFYEGLGFRASHEGLKLRLES